MVERYLRNFIETILRGMGRHIDVTAELASDMLDDGQHVDERDVTLADFRGKWLESTMGEFREDMAKSRTRTWRKLRNARRWASLRSCKCGHTRPCRNQKASVDDDVAGPQRLGARSQLVVWVQSSRRPHHQNDCGWICSLVLGSEVKQTFVQRFLDITRAHPRCVITRRGFPRLLDVALWHARRGTQFRADFLHTW